MGEVRTDARALAHVLDAELVGDGAVLITRIAPLQTADAATVSFLAHPKYRSQLDASAAGCVIVSPALRDAVATRPAALLHPSAVVEPGARIALGAQVGALAFIGAGAEIASHAVIGPHAVIEADARVGEGTQLRARAVLGRGCRVGARGIVHSGVVIGADGFGFAPEAGRWTKIEQLGAVRIGDDVEIGANSCIDRGALEDTVLEDGVKLDNLVQIAHNVHVGAHTAMAGCVGVAGSARIGRHCTVGGGAIILGHLELVDHVHISAATVVSRSIRQPGQYSGVFPFDDNASWEKNAATLRQLHALRDRLRALEKRVP